MGPRNPRSQHVTQSRDPLATWTLPARAPEVDLAGAVEGHHLAFQQVALDGRAQAVAMAAAARGVDDTLPGNQMKQRRSERAERHPDCPRAARLPEDRRDLAVGDDLAAWNA